MGLQTKTIGRMPTDHGPYDPELAYGKKFQCELFGCVWESLHDNNNTTPAVWDGGDIITPNLVDWKKASGDYNAWLMNKDKPASTGTTGDHPYNGMGRVTIPKNIVEGVNVLTQEAFEDSEGNPLTNTIFVIKYDFVLGEDITVPANCVLEFDGGSIANGTINGTSGNPTLLKFEGNNIFNNITFGSNIYVDKGKIIVSNFSLCPDPIVECVKICKDGGEVYVDCDTTHDNGTYIEISKNITINGDSVHTISINHQNNPQTGGFIHAIGDITVKLQNLIIDGVKFRNISSTTDIQKFIYSTAKNFIINNCIIHDCAFSGCSEFSNKDHTFIEFALYKYVEITDSKFYNIHTPEGIFLRPRYGIDEDPNNKDGREDYAVIHNNRFISNVIVENKILTFEDESLVSSWLGLDNVTCELTNNVFTGSGGSTVNCEVYDSKVENNYFGPVASTDAPNINLNHGNPPTAYNIIIRGNIFKASNHAIQYASARDIIIEDNNFDPLLVDLPSEGEGIVAYNKYYKVLRQWAISEKFSEIVLTNIKLTHNKMNNIAGIIQASQVHSTINNIDISYNQVYFDTRYEQNFIDGFIDLHSGDIRNIHISNNYFKNYRQRGTNVLGIYASNIINYTPVENTANSVVGVIIDGNTINDVLEDDNYIIFNCTTNINDIRPSVVPVISGLKFINNNAIGFNINAHKIFFSIIQKNVPNMECYGNRNFRYYNFFLPSVVYYDYCDTAINPYLIGNSYRGMNLVCGKMQASGRSNSIFDIFKAGFFDIDKTTLNNGGTIEKFKSYSYNNVAYFALTNGTAEAGNVTILANGNYKCGDATLYKMGIIGIEFVDFNYYAKQIGTTEAYSPSELASSPIVIGERYCLIDEVTEEVIWDGSKWTDGSGKRKVGTTAERPTMIYTGFIYHDITTNTVVMWNGTAWVDATGTTV